MVPFGGWELPVQYQGILAEASAVRTGAGLFDVSHMGRIEVRGPDARALLDWVHTADLPEAMDIGRARYGLLCNEQGGIIDDGIVYRLAESRFLLVANAANTPTVMEWLSRWQDELFPSLTLDEQTDRTALLALQGPTALGIIAGMSDFLPDAVRPFRVVQASVQGRAMLIARTGYTGEDGVELMPSAKDAPWLWELLMAQGAVPCGLGSRDTLRLEAGLLLHGHDLDTSVNPIEAGLDRFVGKGEFCGVLAVRRVQEQGPERRLVGFESAPRIAMPRPGTPILAEGTVVGQVTSGSFSPTLDRNIGLGYLPMRLTSPGAQLKLDIRGKLVDATVVSLPFYARPSRAR
jgi:aminomethyltransferase